MTKFLNTDLDSTLGGLTPSDEKVSSQKAVKTYVDNTGAKKVDKTSTASQVYVTNASGNQSTLSYSQSNSADSIAQRDADGQITVNQIPTANDHAASKKYVDDGLSDKQAVLVSGTNIKTINNQSLLGSGNIDIQTGSSLPDMTDQSGKYLTTDGTSASWKALATVANSGSYTDLTDKPTIPAAQQQVDWNASSGITSILNKPTLSAVATSGDYEDLTNKPTIPASVTVDQTYSATSTNAQSGTAVASAISEKQDTVTGAATTITSSNLTSNRALISNDSGKVAVSNTTSTELEYVNGVTSSIQTQFDTITGKIPASATSSNQLADKAFVNSSINAVAAYYITANTAGDAFATKAALDVGPYYYDGAARTPTKNDYAIVDADETKDNACTRYTYTGSQWSFQYIVNNSPFTQAQVDAINSEINSTLVTNYSAHIADATIHVTSSDKTTWNGKQDAITGAATTVTSSDLTANRALISNANGKIAVSPKVTSTELGYLDGVTSAIQTQLNNKVAKNAGITGGTKCKITYDSKGLVTSGADLVEDDVPDLSLSKIKDVTATAAEVNVLDGITASTAELNYVDGVTSAIQTQLDGKQETLVGSGPGQNIKTINDNSLLGSGNITIDSLPSQTGQDGKFLTTDGTTASWQEVPAGASLPVLTPMWFDHIANDVSWLRADTFSWQSGDVYVAAYEHLVADYESATTGYSWTGDQTGNSYITKGMPSVGDTLVNGAEYTVGRVGSNYILVYKNGKAYETATLNSAVSGINTSQTETIGDITITYYLADDGHKICLPDQEANISALYESTGVAWYYILDTTNKQFKLPRTKFGFTGIRSGVGGYVEAGLPNITGSFSTASDKNLGNGAFSWTTNKYATNGGGQGGQWGINFSAKKSNAIYGNSTTVQPPATQMYLYFYVGNFEQSAIEQTAGLNAEMFNDLNAHKVIEFQAPTSANNYTWYRKYADGWVEQGGTVTTASNTATPVTLPIPMVPNQFFITNSSRQPVKDWSAVPTVKKGEDGTKITVAIVPASGSGAWVSGTIDWQVSGMSA